MDPLSIILVALVVLWVVAAVVYLIRHPGSGCCCGGSPHNGCHGNCSHCKGRGK